MGDGWTNGATYESYVGRWSRLVAAEFVDWLDVPPQRTWVDVGCGTGALTETVLRNAAPERVTGLDSSAAFVAHAAAHVTDERAAFATADGQALGLADRSADAVVSGLVLNFVPDQARMAAEMARVTRDVAAAYVWDYAGEMQLVRRFWDAAATLDPAAGALQEGLRFELCHPEPLSALWRAVGLGDVEARPIDVPTVFADFDDYWTPFLGGTGPAPAYCVSLAPAARDELRETLRSTLPVEADGSIHLVARAWAVRGRRAG